MTAEPTHSETVARPPWWRQTWIQLTVAILVGEIAAVWLLSSSGRAPARLRSTTQPRFRLVAEADESVEGRAWGLLMSPAVMLMPSGDDFSGAGWLSDSKAEVALEAFLARTQPLPFEPIRGGESGLASLPRMDPGPGSRWETPGGMRPLPAVPPVAMPTDGRVRILEGFAGWTLDGDVKLAPLAGGLLAQRAVVRLMIDGSGTPASPAVVWESSGEPVADEAAVRVAGKLRFRPGPGSAGGGLAMGLNERVWGLVALTWPAPVAEGVGGGSTKP